MPEDFGGRAALAGEGRDAGADGAAPAYVGMTNLDFNPVPNPCHMAYLPGTPGTRMQTVAAPEWSARAHGPKGGGVPEAADYELEVADPVGGSYPCRHHWRRREAWAAHPGADEPGKYLVVPVGDFVLALEVAPWLRGGRAGLAERRAGG